MKTLLSLFLLGLLSLCPMSAAAQQPGVSENYPTRSVRVIVPRPPGNANDLIARILVDMARSNHLKAVAARGQITILR